MKTYNWLSALNNIKFSVVICISALVILILGIKVPSLVNIASPNRVEPY